MALDPDAEQVLETVRRSGSPPYVAVEHSSAPQQKFPTAAEDYAAATRLTVGLLPELTAAFAES